MGEVEESGDAGGVGAGRRYSWTPLKSTQPQALGPWPGEISSK